MLNVGNTKLFEGIRRLNDNPDFVSFMGWLDDSRKFLAKSSLVQDGTVMYRTQGAALCLGEVVHQVMDAVNILEQQRKTDKMTECKL